MGADLEQLTQKGPRGNCDGVVVGERIGCGVRKIANDLKGVCGLRPRPVSTINLGEILESSFDFTRRRRNVL